MNNGLTTKKERLLSILKGYGSLLIAYSGGVDSTFLLALAHEALKKNLTSITAESPLHPASEIKAAKAFAQELGVQHLLIQSREMSQTDFKANTKKRCYLCKKYLFEDLTKIAYDLRIKHVAHGANLDDLEDFRPGFDAAREMKITAPMVDAGLTKNDIRMLSKRMSLKTWNKPPMSCLATRIPYGTQITTEKLKMIEKAEQIILGLGFTGCRVRLHSKVARIEIDPSDVERIFNQGVRSSIVEKLREIGFSHVALDLEGYQQGSMNRSL
jgi:pyridinium-3,5-biscarboxylic acid mononucleotide sulfurtransferase